MRQDESNFNLLFSLTLFSKDGNLELLGDSNGYLDLNFYQQILSSNFDQANIEKKKAGSTIVIKTTEVIFMINRTKKEMFLNYIMKPMSIIFVLTVYQVSNTMALSVSQIITNIVKLKFLAAQTKLIARIKVRLMST